MVTESKNYHPGRLQRLVLYPLAFLLFALLLAIILLLANGYRVDYKDHHFVYSKTGMIIVSSRPNDAEVILDGKSTNKRTGFTFLPVQLQNIFPGKHSVKLVKDGFRTWEKPATVKVDLVTWLNYVLLFPNDLKLRGVNNMENKSVITQSDNGRYLFLSTNENSADVFYTFDINNSNLNKIWPRNFVPKEDWLKQPKILSAQFNYNADKLLLKTANGDKTDYSILETSPDGKIYSLSTSFNFDFEKVIWNPFDSNEIFVLSKGSLYRINVTNPVANVPVATNVIDFSLQKDRNIYYVLNDNNQYKLYSSSFDGTSKNMISNAIAKDTSYKFAFSDYANAIAILPVNEKTLSVFYRLSGQIGSVQLDRNVSDFSWSPNDKKVLYFNNNEIKCFDWDAQSESKVSNSNKISSVKWYFDDAHYIVNDEKGLSIMDFDGTNIINFSQKTVPQFFMDSRSSSFIFGDPAKNNFYIKYHSNF